MKPEARRCKCLHCKMLFVPDYRNRGRQKYCSTPECQQASKRARQQRWLSKPENRDHFRGAENVQRVREWREAHPGYWKRCPRKAACTLQDACSAQPIAIKEVVSVVLPEVCPSTLQDVCQVQTPLIVGLISKFTDLYVTRRHRPFRPASDSQGAGHSGSTFQQVRERKHVI